jgi:hypothetical protein
VPCGQCLSCRINKRRVWTHRIMLEALKHHENSFITLTYSDENYPKGGSLDPKELQNFIKRLRKANVEDRLRYYSVGEYGDTTQRPHYHLALFGSGSRNVDRITKAWSRNGEPIGLVDVGHLTFASAQYIAGYVTKKMTKKDDPRLKGRYPEFARMSRNPGIGANAIEDIQKTLKGENGKRILNTFADVPTFLRSHGKNWPLGRYMVEKLRKEQGWEKNDYKGWIYPEEIQKAREAQQEMRTMQHFEESIQKGDLIRQEKAQKALNQEVKHEIYNQRKL